MKCRSKTFGQLNIHSMAMPSMGTQFKSRGSWIVFISAKLHNVHYHKIYNVLYQYVLLIFRLQDYHMIWLFIWETLLDVEWYFIVRSPFMVVHNLEMGTHLTKNKLIKY